MTKSGRETERKNRRKRIVERIGLKKKTRMRNRVTGIERKKQRRRERERERRERKH